MTGRQKSVSYSDDEIISLALTLVSAAETWRRMNGSTVPRIFVIMAAVYYNGYLDKNHNAGVRQVHWRGEFGSTMVALEKLARDMPAALASIKNAERAAIDVGTAVNDAAPLASYRRVSTGARINHLAKTSAGRAALALIASPATIRKWQRGGKPRASNRAAVDAAYEAARNRPVDEAYRRAGRAQHKLFRSYVNVAHVCRPAVAIFTAAIEADRGGDEIRLKPPLSGARFGD